MEHATGQLTKDSSRALGIADAFDCGTEGKDLGHVKNIRSHAGEIVKRKGIAYVNGPTRVYICT